MKVALKLAELLQKYAEGKQRGTINAIVKGLKEKGGHVERHTVAAMLNNEVKYLSVEVLGPLCEYLIDLGVPAALLPGALFELVPGGFMEMLADSRDLAFCLGQRRHETWPGQDFVVATDSQLQSELLARILRCRRPADETAPQVAAGESADYHRLHQFYLTAPSERGSPEQWSAVCGAAREHYGWVDAQGADTALIALGSNKVNSMVELILATAFAATPFESQDDVAHPRDRACPLMFRYRQGDPKPPSCCGGSRLARDAKDAGPGIYYETKDGHWECCPCEDPSQKKRATRDAAFVCYRHRPNVSQVELACGGFSGRATGALATLLDPIVRELPPPQYSGAYEIGMFVITFEFPAGPANPLLPPKHEVIPLDADVIHRRLATGLLRDS